MCVCLCLCYAYTHARVIAYTHYTHIRFTGGIPGAGNCRTSALQVTCLLFIYVSHLFLFFSLQVPHMSALPCRFFVCIYLLICSLQLPHPHVAMARFLFARLCMLSFFSPFISFILSLVVHVILYACDTIVSSIDVHVMLYACIHMIYTYDIHMI